MDKSTRVIFWTLVTLVLLSGLSTIWFFLGKENLYKEYIRLQDTLKTTIERFTEELKLSNSEKLKVQEKLDVVYSQLKSIEKEKNTLKSEHEEVLEQNEFLRKELARLSKEGMGLKNRIKELEGEEFIARLLRENASFQVKLEGLKEKQTIEQSLKNIEVEKGLLEERLKEANSIAEVLTRDLLRERAERGSLASQIEQTKLENSILKSQVADAERRNFELQKTLAKLNEDYMRVAREAQDDRFKLTSLEKAVRDKEDEIEKMRVALKETQEVRAETYKKAESVELPPIIVTTERTEVAKAIVPPLFESDRPIGSNRKGKIITVNREHNFVVIDLGEKDGVRVGTKFSVYRGERELATLEVIQTRERIAAADIKETNTGLEIMPDDIVVMQ